jgi:hypothetical protein
VPVVSVVLTIAQTVGEADVIAALLKTEGITCSYPWYGNLGEGGEPGVEIRVGEADYERARELVQGADSA